MCVIDIQWCIFQWYGAFIHSRNTLTEVYNICVVQKEYQYDKCVIFIQWGIFILVNSDL